MLKEPIALQVFIHEDLSDYTKEDLYKRHFSWLAADIESITGRKMLIRLIEPSEARDLSSHPYQNLNERASLSAWKTKIDKYRNTNLDLRLIKFLLLTRNSINSRTRGIAELPGYVGIASTEKVSTAAHEVGHMFGATHEDAEILYNGWWSETVMSSDEFSPLRSNADRFSDKNRENIRKYLSTKVVTGPVQSTLRPEEDWD